jgi:glycosyltransferase involved in cell wall biosynthesis
MATMKIAILTGSISRQAGGTFDAIRRPTSILTTKHDVTFQVLGTHDSDTELDLSGWEPLIPETFAVKGPRGFGLTPGMATALERFQPDLQHTHGLWMHYSLINHRYYAQHRTPYVISPHGMLDPWAVKNSAWKKRLIGWCFENKHLAQASCLHALCEVERDAIRAFGLKNPVCVIPNGIDLPHRYGLAAPWQGHVMTGQKVLLYLGRLHPKKGLSNLLSAWRQVADGANRRSDWVLALAGWDQKGHEADLRQLATVLGINQSVLFLGPQFDAAKQACYENADAFVLPSFSEGLPMTVLEAWANGLPTLMTPHCNMPEGFATEAAIRIDPTVESIAEGLERIISMNNLDRSVMGQRGLSLVEEKFTWTRVAAQMYEVYDWLLGNGSPPECVVN